MHVRRTDHVSLARRNNAYTDDSVFFSKANEAPESPLFLACDNRNTQLQFLKKFGSERICFYGDIDQTASRHCRQTSLEHAVIDLYLLAWCASIVPSGYSSFSEAAEILSMFGRVDVADFS